MRKGAEGARAIGHQTRNAVLHRIERARERTDLPRPALVDVGGGEAHAQMVSSPLQLGERGEQASQGDRRDRTHDQNRRQPQEQSPARLIRHERRGRKGNAQDAGTLQSDVHFEHDLRDSSAEWARITRRTNGSTDMKAHDALGEEIGCRIREHRHQDRIRFGTLGECPVDARRSQRAAEDRDRRLHVGIGRIHCAHERGNRRPGRLHAIGEDRGRKGPLQHEPEEPYKREKRSEHDGEYSRQQRRWNKADHTESSRRTSAANA